MHPRIFHSFFPALITLIILFLSSAISACGTPSLPPVGIPPTSPITSPVQTEIIWPFHPNNDQWAIINGYRGYVDHALGKSPNNYAHLAFDFAICFPDKVMRTQGSDGSCDLTNEWDKANTDRKVVYSPVTGHVQWIDDGKNPSSICRSLGIELDNDPQYYITLSHVQELYHNDDSTKPIKVGDPLGQDEPIGVVSGATDGGCYGGADHIHMALSI